MPIYEYECPACGVFEIMQGINEKALSRCPTCKNKKVKKIISETCFQLKGSGWYVTDYGKGNNPGNAKSKADGNGNGNGNGHDSKAETPAAPAPAPAAASTDKKPAADSAAAKH